MPFQPVPDCLQIVFNWSHSGGAEAKNVLHFRLTVAPPMTHAAAEAIAGIVDTALEEVTGVVSAQWELPSYTITDIRAEDGNQFVISSEFVPTAAGDEMPGYVSMCLGLLTDTRGRSGRGRFFTVGATEPDNVGGVPSAAYQAAWGAFGSELATDVNFLVVSRYQGFELVTHDDDTVTKEPLQRDPAVSFAITDVHVPTLWTTQRRRYGRL